MLLANAIVVYHNRQMRRGFSIFLILFFCLGPLATILLGSEDASLPPCCRRHGAHHCAMAMRMAAMMAQALSGSTPVLTAPLTCPFYPGFRAGTASTTQALAASPVSLPVLLARPHTPAAGRAAARMSQVRTRASRGPPALFLS
jgi:drug/metabolite transporter (DMT)-like permease